MNYAKQLKSGSKKLAVWGLGYIGFSSISHFARNGVSCIGIDINEERVKDVNKGKATIPNLALWLGFETESLAADGRMVATNDWKEVINKDVLVHLITVPTEMHGKPYHEILQDVIQKLSEYKEIESNQPPLVIVESTLTPSVADNIVIPLFEKNGLIVGKDILLGVAPRRDWFGTPDKTIQTIPRVVGGTNKETTDEMQAVLSIISNTVLKAKDHKHAALVKSIENAYRHVEITLANQLSHAYPDMDMVEILRLVGTKWNIGTFYPSFGTGGYCIPLGPQYVLEGAKNPEELTILKESLHTDFTQPERVVNSLLESGVKNVAILGVAYTRDLKVHVLSPSIPIIRLLKNKGINVRVQDPYYTSDEIRKIVNCESFNFPDDLKEFDAILLAAGHSEYKYTPMNKLLESTKTCRLILDNTGVWQGYDFSDPTNYIRVGQKDWLHIGSNQSNVGLSYPHVPNKN